MHKFKLCICICKPQGIQLNKDPLQNLFNQVVYQNYFNASILIWHSKQ